MTVGELQRALAGLPPDAAVLLADRSGAVLGRLVTVEPGYLEIVGPAGHYRRQRDIAAWNRLPAAILPLPTAVCFYPPIDPPAQS